MCARGGENGQREREYRSDVAAHAARREGKLEFVDEDGDVGQRSRFRGGWFGEEAMANAGKGGAGGAREWIGWEGISNDRERSSCVF